VSNLLFLCLSCKIENGQSRESLNFLPRLGSPGTNTDSESLALRLPEGNSEQRLIKKIIFGKGDRRVSKTGRTFEFRITSTGNIPSCTRKDLSAENSLLLFVLGVPIHLHAQSAWIMAKLYFATGERAKIVSLRKVIQKKTKGLSYSDRGCFFGE